jgi:Cu2+-exporting ATPase
MSVPAPPVSSDPLLLEVEGMKCGGCVRAVEQRLLQHPGVRQVSVNLVTRTAWVDLDPTLLPAVDLAGDSAGDRAVSTVAVEPLVASLAGLGFAARLRDGPASLASRVDQQRQQDWWQRWRQLVVALSLLVVSSLGHLADAGQLPWLGPFKLLGNLGFHALIATLVLAGPGRPILVQGWRSALAGRPGMDTLVGLGVGSATVTSLVGWLWPASGLPCFFHEPVMLLGFVLTGRFLEERARWRTGRAISQLAALQPDQALLLLDDGPPRQVRVGGLRPGDRLRLLPGDRVPVDGLVLEGTSALDCSSLTGEPLPMQAQPGSELAAGTLNLEAPMVMEVRRSGGESAIARIVHLVEQAQARKAPIQGVADRIAGRFTVVVLGLAIATFLFWWLWGAGHWPELLAPPSSPDHAGHAGHGQRLLGAAAATPLALALQLSIAVLVVACPCALGLATPTAITVGLGQAARCGLLFRGGDAIETAAALRTVLFDKTGTLTLGRPLVERVALPAQAQADAADRVIQLAASLEQHSRHPLAHALLQEAQRRALPLLPVLEVRGLNGSGLMGELRGEPEPLRVGRLAWLGAEGVQSDADLAAQVPLLEADGASLLGVASGTRLLGLVAVQDRPRPEAATTLAALRRQGLTLGVLSGDRLAPVQQLANALALLPSELVAELSPEQKLERILAQRGAGTVAMVGDGINDAPALAAADLGIAVGTGTQIAQESAGLVMLGDQLGGLLTARRIARRTMAKVRQNLLWAFGYNLIALPLAAGLFLPRFGLVLSPPLAALLMALSSLTVVLNALLLQDDDPHAQEPSG